MKNQDMANASYAIWGKLKIKTQKIYLKKTLVKFNLI